MLQPRTAPIVILGIESSCDETAAAVLVDGVVRSNVVASQDVHRQWGGVVPELAGRAHQENIVPVVARALAESGLKASELSAVAFTRGPGLIGALLVGSSFARSFAQAMELPLVAVDHVRAHVMAHFIVDAAADRPRPEYPFLNITVSGGHTQLVLVRSPLDMEVVGRTLDDAAGEAFDKGAKVLGLPYPGGPEVDRSASGGDPTRLVLPIPAIERFDMSFSGIKTAFMALVRKQEWQPSDLPDLSAALQDAILRHLLVKARKAMEHYGLRHIGVAGGVAANSELRKRLQALAEKEGWTAFVPPAVYCTDNAAMIAMAGHHMHAAGLWADQSVVPVPRIGQVGP